MPRRLLAIVATVAVFLALSACTAPRRAASSPSPHRPAPAFHILSDKDEMASALANLQLPPGAVETTARGVPRRLTPGSSWGCQSTSYGSRYWTLSGDAAIGVESYLKAHIQKGLSDDMELSGVGTGQPERQVLVERIDAIPTSRKTGILITIGRESFRSSTVDVLAVVEQSEPRDNCPHTQLVGPASPTP